MTGHGSRRAVQQPREGLCGPSRRTSSAWSAPVSARTASTPTRSAISGGAMERLTAEGLRIITAPEH